MQYDLHLALHLPGATTMHHAPENRSTSDSFSSHDSSPAATARLDSHAAAAHEHQSSDSSNRSSYTPQRKSVDSNQNFSEEAGRVKSTESYHQKTTSDDWHPSESVQNEPLRDSGFTGNITFVLHL